MNKTHIVISALNKYENMFTKIGYDKIQGDFQWSKNRRFDIHTKQNRYILEKSKIISVQFYPSGVKKSVKGDPGF
jgi:hypothetical protein